MQRLEDITQIYQRAFDSAKGYQEYNTQQHEFKFLIGDLNFRIELDDESVRAAIESQNYNSLLIRD
jgi:hypothetical protein